MGMTQLEFTHALGPGYPSSNGWLSEVERGINGIATHDLARIAEVTGRSTEYFLDPTYDDKH